MTTKNLLDNPFFLFIFCITAILVNTIFSAYFLMITFSGFIFLMFYVALKNKYYYSLIVVIMTFTILEYNMGLKMFTLSIISMFLYVFIIPLVSRFNFFNKNNKYVNITIFYAVLYLTWGINTSFSEILYFTLLINLLVDAFLLGVLLWLID